MLTKLKKVAALLVTFTLLSSGTAFAKQPNISEDRLNQYLQTAGYPEDVINLLELPQKQDLYKQKARYSHHQRHSENLVENSQSKTTSTNTMSIMSLPNFTSTIVASQVPSSVKGTVRIVLNYNWDWNYTPVFTAEDRFGIAWTDDFDAIPSSAKYSYRVYGRSVSGVKGESSTGLRQDYASYGPGTGIGWTVNLIHAFSYGQRHYTVYRHKGWGQVTLTKAHDRSGKVDSSSASGKYFHKYLNISGELGFSGTGEPNISISNSWAYDESRDRATSWYWYHKDI